MKMRATELRQRTVRATYLVFALALLLAVAPGASAQRTLVLESFDAYVRVDADGSVHIIETIKPRFTGKWNGIYRLIPIEYRTPQGYGKNLYLNLDSITDESGGSLKYEESKERHYKKFKIWVPGAQDATRTVVLSYTVPNALLFFEDHDELYWNITGDEWEIPIEHASATIELPSGVTGVRTLAFTGAYGSREQDADVRVDGNRVYFTMRRSLSFREGLTAVVGWDKGFVREPTQAQMAGQFLSANWPLFLPVFCFAGMFMLWWTRGKDPERMPVQTEYEPPSGMSPAEVGTLIDNSADMRDITATLVDLAVRGWLTIEEKEESHMLGLWTSKDHVFHKRDPKPGAKPLKGYERQFYDALFSFGSSVKMSDLTNRFYTYLPGIQDGIYSELLGRGYYNSRPDKVKAAYIVGGVFVGILFSWAGGALAQVLHTAPFAWITAGVLCGVTIIGFGLVMPARTIKGARALEGVLGFEEFLGRVESDRFARVIKTPEMFEKFLPYAMALGVEKNWVRAFDDIMQRPPDWYQGSNIGRFRATDFVGSMNRMSTAAAATMASAPRSSGSSGFGGGGSSGGGGGGGGGGGF